MLVKFKLNLCCNFILMRLSIIVPVFNSATFLEKNLTSLLSQDLPTENFEIILINDGSTDDSEKIAKAFARKYPQIKYFFQENKGLGGARNTGVGKSSGEYVMFVDSDDWLVENSLKSILEYSSQQNLDLLIFNLQRVFPDGKIVPSTMDYPEKVVMSGEELILKHRIFVSPCVNLYRRNILVENNIKFVEGVYFEDIDFYLNAILKSNKVAFVKEMVYNYLWNENSITLKQNAEQNTKKYAHYILAIHRLQEIISKTSGNLKERLNYILEYYFIQLIKMSYNKGLNFAEARKAFHSLKQQNLLPMKIKQFEQTKNDKARLFYLNKWMFKNRTLFNNRYNFTVLLIKLNNRLNFL